jgi:hypothetical protein
MYLLVLTNEKAMRSKASVYSRSLPVTVGSNPTGYMDVCLCVCCVLSEVSATCRSLVQRVLPTVLCDQETSGMRRPCPMLGSCARKKN